MGFTPLSVTELSHLAEARVGGDCSTQHNGRATPPAHSMQDDTAATQAHVTHV
jgi:hypothetical protein